MRKLVITPDNTIYWATVNEKNNTMNENTRVDVTDNAIDVVFDHLANLEGFREDGFAAYELSKTDGKDISAFLCVFDSNRVTFVTRERYEMLLEYEAMCK